MRLKDRIAIVVGAGQSPGEGMGNGRATALTFAREGASVLCVDRNLASAQTNPSGFCWAFRTRFAPIRFAVRFGYCFSERFLR